MQIPQPDWLSGLAVLTSRHLPILGQIMNAFASYERANYIAIEKAITDLELVPGIPTGVIMAWPIGTAPTGWLLCDGATIAEDDYPALYAITGASLPNLKGRVIVGLDASQTEFDTLEETGGAKTVTLTEAQMPKHRHSVGSGPGADQFVTLGTSGSNNAGLAVAAGGTKFDYTNYTPASDAEAHNNLPPYIVLNYIIKT